MKNAMLMMITAGLLAVTPMSAPITAQPSPDASVPAVYTKYGDIKWEKLIPELGAQSAEIAILHVNPKSGATQLMIRCPKNYHAPKHWHTANETHYCVYGNFVMLDQDGKAADLSPGSFNTCLARCFTRGGANQIKEICFLSRWMGHGISTLWMAHL